MISFVEGNLFESPAQVLVNTVNTVGAMGKGIAKEFKRIYPEMFKKYQELCEDGKFNIGTLFLHKTDNKWILNFPTKIHWRNPSKIEYIEEGLKKFVAEYSRLRIHSIAFPPLGAGNGELDFETEIKPTMINYLNDIPIQVLIYPHREDGSLPEHRTPHKIQEWLRSEPESLAFDEVWEDLSNLVKNNRNQSFETLDTKTDFRADIDQEEKLLIISVESNTISISYKILFEFWKQLRSNGFSISEIAPEELGDNLDYLIPILSKLDYVKIVEYTEYRKNNLYNSPSMGLQYYPPIKSSSRQIGLPLSIE